MKRVILIFLVFLYFIQLNAIINESGNLFNFFFGNEPNCAYSKWESHIVEGIAEEGYNMYAPYERQTQGFGQFSLPSSAQEDVWENAVDLFFAGEYNDAHNLFIQNDIPYSVVKFTDGANIYYMLRENLNISYIDNNGTTSSYDDEIGSFDFGWGIFVYRTTNPSPVLVTAPHPNDDFISPYLSFESFRELDAQYLMINGSGREVMWTENGNYSNNSSLSDPTRNTSHPFNYVYKKACDKIREDYDRRELSVQIHSYDWDAHPFRASCQISPGQYHRPAGIPIRDFSPLGQDLIKNTDYLVIPQGTIGNNDEVTVTDYYSVHNYFFDTYYNDTVIISNDVDLPGYPGSYHDEYSTSNFSDWDIFSPFFHVEFDELPNCYTQTEESFKEFYGYNNYANNWNLAQKYLQAAQYYQPFIDGLSSAVDSWEEFDDGELPEAPTNLRRHYGSSGNAIAWDTAPCYDFNTYEILYSLNPISQGGYSTLNRDNIDNLAFPVVDNIALYGLNINQTYHIAMRTKDYNGNVSALSEELIYSTLPITTSEFDIFAGESSIEISWTLYQQQNCAGFAIYRSQNDGDFELYSSYTSNDNLEINSTNEADFIFIDEDVELGNAYSYMVHVVTNSNLSAQISQIMNAALANYNRLYSSGNSWNKLIVFGKSLFATYGYEDTYDAINGQSNSYLAINSNNLEFTRKIIPEFDPTINVQYLDLVIDTPPSNLSFTLDSSRNSERFYLLYNNVLHSLNNQTVELAFSGGGSYNAKLVWGNLQAKVDFPDLTIPILYEGNSLDLSWEIDYPELVESVDLYFLTEETSILIAENLPANQTSYSYTSTIPDDYRMANLVVQVTSQDGQIINYRSDQRIALVADIPVLEFQAGNSNQLFAYPFTEPFDTNLLSESLEAFEFGTETFVASPTFLASKGYFINILNDFQLDYNGNPFLQEGQYPLSRGWNLINNIHPLDYAVKDLLFERNGAVLSFKNMAENGYILPRVFGVRSDSYVPIDTLKAFESAFLLQTNNDDINIVFDPVNLNENLDVNEAELFFTVEFKTASGAKDEVNVGLQPGLTPIIDFDYDLVKPPTRPAIGLREVYLISEPPLSNYYPKMQTKLLEASGDGPFTWEISFTNTLDEAVQVRIKNDNNSNNYPLDLTFGGEVYRLSHEFQTINNSNQSGTLNANLTITTVTENNENDTEAIPLFKVSPNPISKEAKISLKNIRNKDYSITIYNIKGQKVRSFTPANNKGDDSMTTWDLTNKQGKKVSSGIYFIQYKDKGRSETRKVCVIK